jgi:hypothetical protein
MHSSGTPSRAVHCLRVRVWTRSRFCSATRDANVTRAVYVRELADTRRRSMRRSRMVAEFSDILNQ